MTDVNSSSERCVLCLDQKRSPVRIQCGHSFCYGCLDVYKSYRKYPWANKCPICRDVLKEKKRTTKRKYSEMSTGPENLSNSTNSFTVSPNNSNLTTDLSIPNEQMFILEEFMSLAADYDYNSENPDNSQIYNNFNNYENLDNAVQYLTEDEDNSFYREEEEDDLENVQIANENDNFRDDLNFYTDSEYDNNDGENYEDDDYEDNYYYYEEESQISYQPPPRSRRNLRSYYQQDYYNDVEIINVDEDSYEVDRNWFNTNNNFNLNNSQIDWESVIASDVIIID